MTTLRIAGVAASHGGRPVLHGLDLVVPSGTTSAILGPSGCGKTTLLRVVAGFQTPDAGTVQLGDDVVVGPGVQVSPERRGIGYVAQEGNLFPHLSVGANVAYGLRRSARRAGTRAAELLELVGLSPDLAIRRPDQLSGGQQQRVALARALARRPAVVLLDEPFSSLDAGLRATTRDAVAEALAHEGVTVVLVTHDQAEALSFADEVALMHEGRFSQVGTPAEVYASPADRHTAAFLGGAVFLRGTADGAAVTTALGRLAVHHPAPAGPVDVLVRPEQLELGLPSAGRPCAEVVSTSYFGHDALVALRLVADDTVVTARVRGTNLPRPGTVVGLSVAGPARAFATR
ncbi:ABC transporter ATP-binding protein [Nostocoides sp. HKS02]|uniref:ABC transporter ATP-binding protein n=1 Tax=Nostocoides sp. HKS02 TaxID=1813880 RepID=UPI0012B4D59F|nr:ABC transporter ATP-binding protein [Tetrasphaera sp. HKS02]QGN56988.1 ATP-binding cassette domain-containing protein [Tetrasphaera sp. HKS02]